MEKKKKQLMKSFKSEGKIMKDSERFKSLIIISFVLTWTSVDVAMSDLLISSWTFGTTVFRCWVVALPCSFFHTASTCL